jgi:hypothetical protein
MGTGLREIVRSAPCDWLLSGEPHVRFRTLTDLLDVPETDERVRLARKAVPRHGPIRAILRSQKRDGYWGSPKDIRAWWPKKESTFWVLGILGDFGLRRSSRRIAAACEYVFSTQHPSGGFGWGEPPTPAECFTGILVEALVKLGYADDQRLQRAYDWLLSRQRRDGGFWCKDTGQLGRRRQGEPSCAFASLCVLAALVQHPVQGQGTVVSKATEFMLTCWERRGKVKYAGHDSQIGTGWEKLKYPYTDYRILKYLDVLSRIPRARSDPRGREALALLISKRDALGRCTPESIHRCYANFDFGQKRLPSRWLTVLVYSVIRRWATEHRTTHRIRR